MNANPAAYVISTGQQLMNTGNSASQDLKTLAALAVTALILVPSTVAAFRTSTHTEVSAVRGDGRAEP